MGAGRWRVIRQLITESVVLGLAGGFLGVVLAHWTVRGLLALAPLDLSRNISVEVDYRIVVFAVAVSILTGIIFGLAPSVVASRPDVTKGLREDSRASVERRGAYAGRTGRGGSGAIGNAAGWSGTALPEH